MIGMFLSYNRITFRCAQTFGRDFSPSPCPARICGTKDVPWDLIMDVG